MRRALLASMAGMVALTASVIAATMFGGTAWASVSSKHAASSANAGIVAKSYFCQHHPQNPKCVSRPGTVPVTGAGGTYSRPSGTHVVAGLSNSPAVLALPATGGGAPTPAAPALPIVPLIAALLALSGLWVRRLARRL